MRVGVDARSLAGLRGVAHYTGALLEAMARQFPDDRFACLLPGGDAPGAARLNLENVELRRHPLPTRAVFACAALWGRPRLDRLLGGEVDVLWAPALRPLAVSADVPFVLTVHDLSFRERPGDFTAYERLWHRLARPARLVARADRLVVDAAAIGVALSERWPLSQSRLAVVAPGVTRPRHALSAAEVSAVRARHRLPERYLLAVGALEPRKAPELLVQAFAAARREGLAAELVFAGGGRLAQRLRAPGVHVLGYVSEEDLEALYAGARALVMASWLEGFGFPPLEALIRGIPPLVADLALYDQTLGAGALRFVAGDGRDLATKLLAIDGDEQLRAGVVAVGRPRARALTWERAAGGLHRVLSEAATR